MHSNPSPRPSTSSDDLCRADDHDSPIEIDHGDVVKTNRTEGTFAPEEQLFHESERVQDGEPVREGRFAFERIDPPGGTTPQPGSLILSGQVTLPSKTTASEETTPHQNTTSHQATTSATASDGMTATVKSVASKPAESRRVASRRVESRPSKAPAKAGPDPVVQSLMLLMTMAIMLAAARFAVPSIVEEIRYAWLRGELRAEYETGTEGLRNVSLDALSDAYEMVTAAVGPSVVHIEVQRRPEIAVDQLHKMISESPHSGWSDSDQGSGVIVDAEGYVVTNRHVVADGEDITVTLSDGRRVPAVVLGNDALTDLAVLKINASGLIPITWGDSDRCRVGSPVWAVGSPFGLDRTVTFGILSGKHRRVRASTQYQDFMQSDVAVNPGNSGGPLVDARGTLVGINTAIVGDTYQGVSFSIPSNVAKQIYERLVETGRVDRGWLGVRLLEVPEDLMVGDNPRLRGALVSRVTEGSSPAGRAGVLEGDVIIKVDREPIRDTAHLMQLIAQSLSGSEVMLDIIRDAEPIEVPVTLGTRPPEYNP